MKAEMKVVYSRYALQYSKQYHAVLNAVQHVTVERQPGQEPPAP
jgi:hypothetical protein